MEKSVYWQRAL